MDQQQLRDRAEITDLVYRLGAALDDNRLDDLRDLMAEDATVRTPGGQSAGREAMITQAARNHPGDQRFQHVTTNVLVTPDGDRATARANLTVHVTVPTDPGTPAPPPRATLGEVYAFDLVRTEDGWRFARIETELQWVSGALPVPASRHDR
jgi:uncharacterized protein (TIGR02246 family)